MMSDCVVFRSCVCAGIAHTGNMSGFDLTSLVRLRTICILYLVIIQNNSGWSLSAEVEFVDKK